MKPIFDTGAIKARISIVELFARDGHRMKRDGERLLCLCPFHKEGSPSCTLFADQGRFHCFGCGAKGDVFAFVMLRDRIDFKEAARKLADMARVSPQIDNRYSPTAISKATKKLHLPDLRRGTRAELKDLAALRNVSVEGLELASERGLLWFATVKEFPAWLVTDSSRRNAQARRMDGGTWPHIGDKKAYTLPGSAAAWPVGIIEIKTFPCVALVEGGPDLLAAFHFIYCEARQAVCGAVAMLGASHSIHEDALPLFAGKGVRIFAHVDNGGIGAAVRWEKQLRDAGADVDCFKLRGLLKTNGQSVEDLNDLCYIDADQFENERDLWAIMPEAKGGTP